MSLKDKLDRLKEGFKSKAPQDAQEIMHRATEDLKNSGISSIRETELANMPLSPTHLARKPAGISANSPDSPAGLGS